MSHVRINRPWMQSFKFELTPFSTSHADQFQKLCRNYIASLDLGCPSAHHVNSTQTFNREDERQRYRDWVDGWKEIYKELSAIIRFMKSCRKTKNFKRLTGNRRAVYESVHQGDNRSETQVMNAIAAIHLERFQETAQAMLNARWNAKLAAGARRAWWIQEEEKIIKISSTTLEDLRTNAASA